MVDDIGHEGLRVLPREEGVCASHEEQGSMIRRYVIWRNKHAADERLRDVVDRANVA
ncbi:hypothetical protein ACWDX6_28325 [Streptomyces sp. NPDC003027]